MPQQRRGDKVDVRDAVHCGVASHNTTCTYVISAHVCGLKTLRHARLHELADGLSDSTDYHVCCLIKTAVLIANGAEL